MKGFTVIQRKGSLTRIPKKITLVRVLLTSGLGSISFGHFNFAVGYIFLGLVLIFLGVFIWTIKR